MAAIAGIVSLKRGKIADINIQVEKMIQAMRHRGPDTLSVRKIPGSKAALGASGVNLTPARTQCAAAATAPYIVFDGELFNSRPEGQTNADLFNDYYLKYGKNCFEHLDGEYVCAIIDGDETIIARDPVGARPMFYGIENGLFCFSSEMKGLIDHIRFDINELSPGFIYSTKDGLKPFKVFNPEVPQPESLEHAIKTVRELVFDAIKKRTKGVNAVSLSGGLDSSIVAAVAKEFNPDLHLFSASVESADGPDLQYAKIMAEFLGLDHHVYRITNQDIFNFIPKGVWYLESFDEDCVSGMIANYHTAKMVKSYSDSVLVGEGADELFGGYRMVLKNPKVKDEKHREELAKKLLDIAYNTALRRMDRGWMANAVVYRTPFLDSKVIAFSNLIPMKWKIYGDKQVEKYVLREAFKDMLPESIYSREKLRFAMGTGVDDILDDLVSSVADPELITRLTSTFYGMPFSTFKEIYYYDEFLKWFPPAYEKQTVRWDPFK